MNGPGSDANPYKWRPSNESQERYASYLSGDPTVNSYPYTNGVPTTTPTNTDTGQSDWGWFLTMLNRGNSAAPTVDTTTNEVVILENYGFNRGGSIAASTDTFLNSVDSVFGSDVGSLNVTGNRSLNFTANFLLKLESRMKRVPSE